MASLLNSTHLLLSGGEFTDLKTTLFLLHFFLSSPRLYYSFTLSRIVYNIIVYIHRNFPALQYGLYSSLNSCVLMGEMSLSMVLEHTDWRIIGAALVKTTQHIYMQHAAISHLLLQLLFISDGQSS